MPRDPEEIHANSEAEVGDGPTDEAAARADAGDGSDAGTESAAAQPASLEEQLAVARRTADDFKDRLYRKAAELENTKRRLQKQVEDTRRYGGEEVLKELLPVVDDLQRALEHAQKSADDRGAADDDPVRGFIQGVSLVMRKLLAAVGKFGVQPFDALGQPFDPQVHEAISQVESADHPPNTVVAEFLKGYMLGERLLRPAVVTVSRQPAPAAESES